MAGLARFFVETKIKSGAFTLEGAEFHHMVRVTRHNTGDTVRLFDGNGHEADAEIQAVTRTSALMKVGKVEVIPVSAGPQLILAVPIPKFTRAGWLVEKAVELNVSKLVPLTTTRSVVDPRDSRIETFRNSIISASKQCGRAYLMEISQPVKLDDLLKSRFEGQLAVVAHPGGMPLSETLIRSLLKEAPEHRSPKGKGADSIFVVIGPEGGLTVEEVAQATGAGARLVGLGPQVLRVETAALLAAGLFQMARIGQP